MQRTKPPIERSRLGRSLILPVVGVGNDAPRVVKLGVMLRRGRARSNYGWSGYTCCRNLI